MDALERGVLLELRERVEALERLLLQRLTERDAALARIEEQVRGISERMRSVVSAEAFAPVRAIAYGLAALMLTGTLLAVLRQVFR